MAFEKGQPPKVLREIVQEIFYFIFTLDKSPSYPPLVVKRVGDHFVFSDIERLPATVRRALKKRG